MRDIAVVGLAPCQCFSPGANQTMSPGRISSTGSPNRWTQPQPVRTIRVTANSASSLPGDRLFDGVVVPMLLDPLGDYLPVRGVRRIVPINSKLMADVIGGFAAEDEIPFVR